MNRKYIRLTEIMMILSVVITGAITYDGIKYRQWTASGYVFKCIIPVAVSTAYIIFSVLAQKKKILLGFGSILIFISHLFIIFGFDTLGKDGGTYMKYVSRFNFWFNIVTVLFLIIIATELIMYINKGKVHEKWFYIPVLLIIGYRFFESLSIFSQYIYCIDRNYVMDAKESFSAIFVNLLFIFQLTGICASAGIKEEGK